MSGTTKPAGVRRADQAGFDGRLGVGIGGTTADLQTHGVLLNLRYAF